MAAAVLCIAGKNACGQTLGNFHLGAWEGTASAGYDVGSDRTRSADPTTDLDTKARRLQEGVEIRNDGFSYIDPRIFTGSAAVNLNLVSDSIGSDAHTFTQRGKLIGYGLDTAAFSVLPYGGNLFAHRTQTLNWQPFGRTQLDYANRGLALTLREDSPLRDWGVPFMTATANFEQQHTQETTVSVLGQAFHRDERRNVASLSAHKGFETGDLDARYEFDDATNTAFPLASFRGQNAGLTYSRDFGPGLAKRSESRALYSSRSGVNALTLLNLDERLHIEHYQNLSTDYGYVLSRSETGAGRTETRDGAFGVRYQPYRDLTADGTLNAGHQVLPAGTRDNRVVQESLQYRHDLPEHRSVFARASGRYQRNDNRMLASSIQIVDEGQAAPSPLGAGSGFTLSQPFVQPATVVVVDTRGGARLPTTPGIDYEVVQEGSATRILPLPTSAVIQPGDALAVSYAYNVDPSLSYSTVAKSVSAGFDFRWVAFTFGHEQSDQHKISGQQDLFLQNMRKDSAQLDLRREWERGRAQTNLGWVRYDSTRLVYTQRRFTPLVFHRPTRALSLALNGDWTATNYVLPLHQTATRTLRASADWYAGNWVLSSAVGRRIYRDSLQPPEAINEASFKARFTYGKLDFNTGLSFASRRREPVETSTWRLTVLATRRF